MTSNSMEIQPLTPWIGAEIFGVDLTRPLSNDQVEAIHKAFLKYLVIFFRDQDLDFASHEALSRHFGELHLPPALAPFRVPDHPGIVKLHIDENSVRAPGELWHSDMSCDAEPPLGSILFLHTVPKVGGDTAFASMYAAYDALSDRMKQQLEGLNAIHDARASMALAETLNTVNEEKRSTARFPRSSHPVIRTHPETKRKTIYVNKSFTTHIVGIPKAESDALLDYLYEHSRQEEFQCRFRWRPNSIAFWDNRAAQHKAIWDYHPQTRSGYRTQICGDKPF